MEQCIETETCYISTAPQGSKEWFEMRRGTITMSILSDVLGENNPRFQPPRDEVAKRIVGLSQPVFSDEAKTRMRNGLVGEPFLREWHSRELGVPIREVGLSIWKKDQRFRGSMDGVIDDDCFVEYKITGRMYRPLLEYLKRYADGDPPPVNDMSHIYRSHYYQMIGNGVINGKKWCDYVVHDSSSGWTYEQWIPIDYDLWNEKLYPEACKFYDSHVKPLTG